MTRTLAALDIGTNSFHLVVARFGEGTKFEVIAREKEMVRLGSGASDMKRLEPEAIDRGIAALTRFRQVAEIHDARLYAVATSAVREADNASEFLERARVEAGIEVDVISGSEEARLIHLGVLQAVPVYDERLLLVDIGGGSTEILIGERGEILISGSFKIGAIRLTRRFFRSETLHPAAIDSCRRYVQAALVPMARKVKKLGFGVAVGSSGTIGAIAAMVSDGRGGPKEGPRTFNNFEVTRKDVTTAVKRLIEAESIEARRRLPGIDDRRADIILGGAIVLEEVMFALEIETMVYSDYALREGVLLDALERERGAAVHHLHDLRRRSVMHLSALMDDDPAHSLQAARLALELFDATVGMHGLSDDKRELLEAAALLSNVGQFVSHDRHHKHSYYVIRNSDHLTGFTDHEIELIALVARYHRKSPPKSSHPEFARLRPDDQHAVMVLAGLLRVAIGLDRTRSALVEHLRIGGEMTPGEPKQTIEDGLLLLEIDAADGADLSLEVYTANERKELLEQVLDRAIKVVVTDSVAAPDKSA